MRIMKLLAAALVTAVLGGCATSPPQPVSLNAAALSSTGGRFGVSMTPLPKVDTEFPGASCLLCLAVASATNSTLTGHVRTLSYEDLSTLKDQAVAAITKKGAVAVVINEEIKLDSLANFGGEVQNFARKDFRTLREKHNVDKLIVIQFSALGVWRNYAAYVPTEDPKAVLKGVVYMVNLQTNALEWYTPIDIVKSAASWDQPPKFPDLTNAYFQALELGKDAVLLPLK